MEIFKYRFLVLTPCGHIIRRPKAAGEPVAKAKEGNWSVHCPTCKKMRAVERETEAKESN